MSVQQDAPAAEREPKRKPKPPVTAPATLERWWTRDEVAVHYHTTATWVTRNYGKLGLKPMRIGKRVLFRESNIAAVDRRASGEPSA